MLSCFGTDSATYQKTAESSAPLADGAIHLVLQGGGGAALSVSTLNNNYKEGSALLKPIKALMVLGKAKGPNRPHFF
jgi:hypothetical protein